MKTSKFYMASSKRKWVTQKKLLLEQHALIEPRNFRQLADFLVVFYAKQILICFVKLIIFPRSWKSFLYVNFRTIWFCCAFCCKGWMKQLIIFIQASIQFDHSTKISKILWWAQSNISDLFMSPNLLSAHVINWIWKYKQKIHFK